MIPEQQSGTAPASDRSSASPLLVDFITERELADGLLVTARTVKRWHSLGIGPPRVLIGRTPYYRRDAVRQWLRSREETPKELRHPDMRRRQHRQTGRARARAARAQTPGAEGEASDHHADGDERHKTDAQVVAGQQAPSDEI
jgi:hypothetical protein